MCTKSAVLAQPSHDATDDLDMSEKTDNVAVGDRARSRPHPRVASVTAQTKGLVSQRQIRRSWIPPTLRPPPPSMPRQKNAGVRPMTMETRLQRFLCTLFKKEIGRYSRAAAMGKTGKKFVFLALFVHAAARGGTCALTLKIVNTLVKNSSRDDWPSIST